VKSKKDPKEIFKKFLHVGVVVRDLERTLNTLTNVFGIGPFKILDFPPKDEESEIEMAYHGKPADFSAKFCFADMGNIELEIS